MEEKDNPFEYHETDLYVACVGENGGTENFDIREGFKSSVNIMIEAVENGEYEDTMIYPVVYNARHSIELSLKIVLEYIIYIYNIKNKTFLEEDKKNIFTHDIELLDSIIMKYYRVDNRIVTKYDIIRPYLEDYYFDKKGDVFKYELDHDGKPHLISQGISSISYDVLKRKFNEVMVLFDNLIFEVMYLNKEYSMGTFTKKLSRDSIKEIAQKLPSYVSWKDARFKEIKEKIKAEYSINSNELSDIINLIKNHCEFCTYIGMELKIGDIPEKELRAYVRLVMEMNGQSLYTNEVKVRCSNMSEINLLEIQKTAIKREELSKDISDNTFRLLMLFREYGRSRELFVERKDRIYDVVAQSYVRHDMVRKSEKKDVFKKILLGMKRCGQITYHEIIKSEFMNNGKQLIELDYEGAEL